MTFIVTLKDENGNFSKKTITLTSKQNCTLVDVVNEEYPNTTIEEWTEV